MLKYLEYFYLSLEASDDFSYIMDLFNTACWGQSRGLTVGYILFSNIREAIKKFCNLAIKN